MHAFGSSSPRSSVMANETLCVNESEGVSAGRSVVAELGLANLSCSARRNDASVSGSYFLFTLRWAASRQAS